LLEPLQRSAGLPTKVASQPDADEIHRRAQRDTVALAQVGSQGHSRSGWLTMLQR